MPALSGLTIIEHSMFTVVIRAKTVPSKNQRYGYAKVCLDILQGEMLDNDLRFMSTTQAVLLPENGYDVLYIHDEQPIRALEIDWYRPFGIEKHFIVLAKRDVLGMFNFG